MRHFFITSLALIGFHLNAQNLTAEEKEVMVPIQQLFQAMNDADSSKIRSAFHPDAAMFTTIVKNDTTKLITGTIDQFVNAIGKAQPGMLEEKIWDFDIKIDTPLAQVWCQYALYVNGQFHHCGVDAFHLIFTDEGWKIFEIADTRRTKNCEEPPN